MKGVGLVKAGNYQFQKNYHLCAITTNEFRIVGESPTVVLRTAEDVCRTEAVSVLWLAWCTCLKTEKRETSYLHSILILCMSY